MYSALEQKLLDNYQRDFPLGPTPFADIANQVGASEADVLKAYQSLKEQGTVGRIGGIFRPGSVGASTLAAMEVPKEKLEDVAAQISAMDAVNHNYEREHRLNLWFVVAADNADEVAATLDLIAHETGYGVLNLPMEEAFHLDLGFKLKFGD